MLRMQSQIAAETRLPAFAPAHTTLLPTRRRRACLTPQRLQQQQHACSRRTVSRASGAEQPSPSPEPMLDTASAEGLPEHRALLESLTCLHDYPALAKWLQQKQQEIINSPSLAVLALIRAADLRHTLTQLENKTEEQIIDAVQAQEQCGEELLPLLRHSLPSLPIDTVAACAQAASLLGDSGFDEGFFYTLAQKLQRAAQPSGHLPCKQDVQGLVFELLVTALARAGYYSPDVMSLLAKDIAAAVGNVQEPGTLAAIVEAYMELQHLDQQLLTSVGRQLLQAGMQLTGGTAAGGGGSGLVLGSLSGLEALQVTLAYAFFNVQNPAFYQVLLARASSVMQQRQQQLGEDGVDDEEWAEEVALLQLACTLKPGGLDTAPAGARALLADEARRLGPQCREAAAEQLAAVWDEEQGQSTQQLMQFQGLELLATRQVTAVLTLGPPPSEHTSPADQQHQQQEQQQQLQPELPVPYALVDSSIAPWSTVDVALPGTHKVGVVLLPPRAFCRNMARLRGSVQAQLRGMQALAWAVWSVSVEDWTDLVEGAAASAGIQGGYEAASDLLAQWLVTVARAERAQILQAVQNAFGKPEGEDAEVLEQLQQESSSSSLVNLQQLHVAFLDGLEQGGRESAAAFFARLQGHVWEGLEAAKAAKAAQLQKR